MQPCTSTSHSRQRHATQRDIAAGWGRGQQVQGDRQRVGWRGSRKALPGAPDTNTVYILYRLIPTSHLLLRKERLLLYLVELVHQGLERRPRVV